MRQAEVVPARVPNSGWLYFKPPSLLAKKVSSERHWQQCRVAVEEGVLVVASSVASHCARVPLNIVTKFGRAFLGKEESLRFIATPEGTEVSPSSSASSGDKQQQPVVEYRYGAIGWYVSADEVGGKAGVSVKRWSFACADDDEAEAWLLWLRSFASQFTSVPPSSGMLQGVPEVAPIESASTMDDEPSSPIASPPALRQTASSRRWGRNRAQTEEMHLFAPTPMTESQNNVITLKSSRRGFHTNAINGGVSRSNTLPYVNDGRSMAHGGGGGGGGGGLSRGQSEVISHPMQSMHRMKGRGRGSLTSGMHSMGPGMHSAGRGSVRSVYPVDSFYGQPGEHSPGSTPQGHALGLSHGPMHSSVHTEHDGMFC